MFLTLSSSNHYLNICNTAVARYEAHIENHGAVNFPYLDDSRHMLSRISSDTYQGLAGRDALIERINALHQRLNPPTAASSVSSNASSQQVPSPATPPKEAPTE